MGSFFGALAVFGRWDSTDCHTADVSVSIVDCLGATTLLHCREAMQKEVHTGGQFFVTATAVQLHRQTWKSKTVKAIEKS